MRRQEGRTRVPEVVEPQRGEPELREQLLVAAGEVAGLEWTPAGDSPPNAAGGPRCPPSGIAAAASPANGRRHEPTAIEVPGGRRRDDPSRSHGGPAAARGTATAGASPSPLQRRGSSRKPSPRSTRPTQVPARLVDDQAYSECWPCRRAPPARSCAAGAARACAGRRPRAALRLEVIGDAPSRRTRGTLPTLRL